MSQALSTYAHAVPFNAISAFGLGPVRSSAKRPATALTSLRRSATGTWYAIETVGAIGGLVMGALAALDGVATAEQFALQTRDADPADIADALERLEVAGIAFRSPDGSVGLTDQVMSAAPDPVRSFGDPQATTSDVLEKICRKLHLVAPSRKADRIQTIADVFGDPDAARAIRDELSPAAADLLARIADAAGPSFCESVDVGVDEDEAHYAAVSAYRRYAPSSLGPSVRALAELTSRGIVGLREWGTELWIWREAWPLVDRPFYTHWPSVPSPEVAPSAKTASRIPSIVGVFDQALDAWEKDPPALLKNGEQRIGSTKVRSTAKLLDVDADIVDLVGRLAIGIELLLANVVAASGRGRKRRVDEVWAPDVALLDAWTPLAPAARWAKMVAEWTDPRLDSGRQLLANRHLVLWELARLDEGVGYVDADAFADWIAHRHGTIGHRVAARECLVDLRSLGVVESTGPLALTTVGRMVIEDPTSLDELPADEATSAFVQADLTVVAPPDLRHDLAARLATLADVEGDSGAVVSRLSLDRITRAVQNGETVESIVDFLTELSSVPVADTVIRLVQDAASRAGRVRVVSAPTVVVVNDPADLATALSVKAARLVQVSDTVAISELTPAKVRTALDRKGLAPELVVNPSVADKTQRASSLDAAREVEQQAAEYRERAARSSNKMLERHADTLAARAQRMADVDARLSVTGPLAVTPVLVERLDTSSAEKSSRKKPSGRTSSRKTSSGKASSRKSDGTTA